MSRTSKGRKALLTLAALSLVAAGCGDDSDSSDAGSGTVGDPDVSVPQGGTLVIGAEQEPDCTDWIGSCAGSSWGNWAIQVQTMPRTFDVVPDGEAWAYAPSILLDGEPELETDPTQVVTYRINDNAVWSDGEPITCADFAYTWDQIATGDDIYDTTGYVNIGAVECPDPKTAVVTFETPFAGWRSLFGGQYGVLPAHLLEGKDRSALMQDGYEFSGGPWLIEEWNRGTDVTLVPNDAYWGDVPKLDKVVFRFIPDTSAEFQAFKAGETDAIYPQPQLDAIEQIDAGIPGAQTYYTAVTGNLEALWMNNQVAPFDSRAVRQAFSYALDRDAIVERLFGGLGITEASQSFNAPIVGDFTDLEAFSGYTRDLDEAADLMEGDGWAKGGDGVWTKDGQRASVTFKTTAGNKRRELTQQIIQEQAKEAGFEVTIENQEAGDLFGSQLPGGDFQLALYAQVLTSLDPSNCPLFCSENIPTAGNGFSGQNWTRTNIAAVDPLLREVDTNLDDDARAAAQRKADGILAEEATSLPLDPLPNILMWSDRVVGPVGDNPIHGPFSNMHLWGLDQ